ncbi:MAG: hypothetical protein WCC92_06165 [Candidatus Korobacteraceae bacterium]
MSVYDDVKAAIEGFITPDLGEIKTRLGVVEASLAAVANAIDAVDQRSERRDQELTRVMERGFDHIEERLDGLSRQLRTEEELRGIVQRLAAVESRLKLRDPEEATH